MWMPPQTTLPPLATARRAAGTSSPAGAKIKGRIELLGGRAERVARPLGSQAKREILSLAISRAREREHPPSLVDRHLADDVGRGAEAVDPESLGVARQAQRAEADQARAQKRCGLQVGIAVGDAGSRSARRPLRTAHNRRRARSP